MSPKNRPRGRAADVTSSWRLPGGPQLLPVPGTSPKACPDTPTFGCRNCPASTKLAQIGGLRSSASTVLKPGQRKMFITLDANRLILHGADVPRHDAQTSRQGGTMPGSGVVA